MAARKPLAEDCTGDIFCPSTGHVVVRHFQGNRSRVTHVPLTEGQAKTLRESGRRPGVLG